MKILKSALCGVVGATMMLGTMAIMAPASAAPLPRPDAPAVSNDIVDVGSRRDRNRRDARRGGDRRDGRRGGRRDRDRFERRGGYAYYRGHRGSRHHRHGWRSYNGWWFPPAAFAGAIIGGAIASQGNAHVAWCYDRYRSYRAYDNSFQPYNGPRRQCISPYS